MADRNGTPPPEFELTPRPRTTRARGVPVEETPMPRTTRSGVPEAPMNQTPSRGYARTRKSDKPAARIVRAIPAALGVVATIASGMWWLAQKTMVTRDEFSEARVKEAKLNAKVANMETSLAEQKKIMADILEGQLRIERTLDRKRR